ncbi:hypothetical protein [Microvirga sp. G4-2]|uniref:hypothetical protein n=1 Tax=Microvirga sp. G4-2 TaxID=3434467 RepID=UPI004043E9FF
MRVKMLDVTGWEHRVEVAGFDCREFRQPVDDIGIHALVDIGRDVLPLRRREGQGG